MNDFKSIVEKYNECRAERDKYNSLWTRIAKYVGISLDNNYFDNNNTNKSNQLDEFIDDPTAAIAVTQFGEYLAGIMWGTGSDAIRIKPSKYVLNKTDEANVTDWYKYATSQALYHINHSKAGFSSCLSKHCYDQGSFGTGGIGVFPNQAYINGVDDNALIFRNYGVDNIAIDEGKSGLVEYIFIRYNWRVNRIINEFCTKNGVVDDLKISQMPQKIQDAWNSDDLNQEFRIVLAILPREDFNPRLAGKKGSRYRGVWFLDGDKDKPFSEDSFAEMPIGICRQTKIRGEIYGRSSSTIMLSTIRSLNYIVGQAIETIEKMNSPALGMYSNSLFGDSVLDTSPDALTVFNPSIQGNTSPLFKMYDVGDPTGIINFLVPYLKESITTSSKVDALLDFNSAKDMTATESLQRYAIRGKSLSSILVQQKDEGLNVWMTRAINVLYRLDCLGVNPELYPEDAKTMLDLASERVIPQEVIDTIKEGKNWYEIEYNNELENLTRTDVIERVVRFIQTLMMTAQVNPQILNSVDYYNLLKTVNDNLGINSKIMISEKEFKAQIAAQAQMQAQAMAMQQAQMGAVTQKDNSIANKNNMEASK